MKPIIVIKPYSSHFQLHQVCWPLPWPGQRGSALFLVLSLTLELFLPLGKFWPRLSHTKLPGEYLGRTGQCRLGAGMGRGNRSSGPQSRNYFTASSKKQKALIPSIEFQSSMHRDNYFFVFHNQHSLHALEIYEQVTTWEYCFTSWVKG